MTAQQDIITRIETNWGAFNGLVAKLTSPRLHSLHNPIVSLVDKEKSRIMTCPSSTRTDFQGAFPGGLVDHSLKVVKLMSDLNKTFGTEIPSESLIVTGLFHDIGKIGNGKFDYYIEKESDWHNKQGIMYEINQKIANTTPSMRSLWWMNEHSVNLTEEEFLAIASIKDRHDNTNDSIPSTGESMLTVILQQAVKVACLRGRGKKSVIDQ